MSHGAPLNAPVHLRFDLPKQAWQLDDPPQRWGRIGYDCTSCVEYPNGRVLR